MTWTTYRNRGEILRAVIAVADERLDGRLPLDVEGATEVFDDELTLIGALQLRWHTRLAGRIERELSTQPMDLEAAVVRAWQDTTEALPGIRAILDHYRVEPVDATMALALEKSANKERIFLAISAGRANVHSTVDAAAAAHVGELIENRARVLSPVPAAVRTEQRGTLLSWLRAALAA